MFTQIKKERPPSEINQEQNLISQGTKIIGDIEAKGSFRIDGTVEGSVKTPGKIVIGKSGFINGNLKCGNADIEGKYSGKLQVSGILSLRATAFIDGEVTAEKLAVEPGATLNAKCDMKGEIKSLPNEGKQQRKKEKSA